MTYKNQQVKNMLIKNESKRKRKCRLHHILIVIISIPCFTAFILCRNFGSSFSSINQPYADDYSSIISGDKQTEGVSSIYSRTTIGSTTKTWPNWPAIAHTEIGHPLVMKGDTFFHHTRDLYFTKDTNGKTLMDAFIQVYKNRPDQRNMCGIRLNHAMALFLAVKQINPTLVVESGVNAGISTYFIRAASPNTNIFALDPKSTPICGQKERWIDPSGKTKYFTGDKFVDLLKLDWEGMILRKEIDVEKTLVFIDDHRHAFKRTAHLMQVGIQHIIIEDNYKLNEGMYECLCQLFSM